MTPPTPAPAPADEVDRYIQRVKNCIEHCITNYFNEEQTINYLSGGPAPIPTYITSLIWRWLQKSNPEFFNEYHLRLQLMRQIKTFNTLLNKQAQFLSFMNKQPQLLPHYNSNLYYRDPTPPPLPSFLQDFPSLGGGQLTQFPDMPVPDSSQANQVCRLHGCFHTGNNMNAPLNCKVPVPNSYLPHGFSNGSSSSFMNQTYHRAIMSSIFPLNGNMPQLPMMHDSPTLPSSAQTPSLTDVHSPMNTEDENGTVTYLAMGAIGQSTMDDSPQNV